jgi:hypothetical protein
VGGKCLINIQDDSTIKQRVMHVLSEFGGLSNVIHREEAYH